MGVHLAPGRVRAVKLSARGRKCEVFETDWDPNDPDVAARAVKAELGAAGAVSLAVDIGFTFVKRVELPEIPIAEKRNILELEPERYFPVRGEGLVVSLNAVNDLVFAMREHQLERWIAAMETLGPIELVEPGPRSLARSLRSQGVTDATVLQLASESGSSSLTEIEGSEVVGARKFFGSAPDVLAELVENDALPTDRPLFGSSSADAGLIRARRHEGAVDILPHDEHCPSDYAIACGAALGIGESTDSSLTTAQLARNWALRERRRFAGAIFALVAAAAFLLFAVDGYRERTQRSIESEIASLRDRGQAVLGLQSEAERIRGNLETLTGIIEERMDPLEVLLTVTRLLPDDAYIRTIDGSESEWRVDGYAGDAANLIPIFEASSSIEEVRFVRATTRVRLGNENYEDFSLVFRYVPQAQ